MVAAGGAAPAQAKNLSYGQEMSYQQEKNLFYELRALGRAESRLTGTVMDGHGAPQALIDRNRELGRSEARWIPEDLGGGVDRQAIGTKATRGEVCSLPRLK